MRRFANKIAAVTILAAVGCGSTGSVVLADEGVFLGLRGFGGWSDPGDISGTGTGTLSERNTADPAAGAGGVIGYRFDKAPLRLELEVLHRVRVDVDLRDTTNNIGYENNLSSTTAMVGLAYEFRDTSDWTPFIAGMAGLAQNNSSVDRTNLATGTTTTTDNDDTNLALAATVGIDYALSESWDLGGAYRFSYLGGFDTGAMAGGESISGDPFLAHDLVLSLQFNF